MSIEQRVSDYLDSINLPTTLKTEEDIQKIVSAYQEMLRMSSKEQWMGYIAMYIMTFPDCDFQIPDERLGDELREAMATHDDIRVTRRGEPADAIAIWFTPESAYNWRPDITLGPVYE